MSVMKLFLIVASLTAIVVCNANCNKNLMQEFENVDDTYETVYHTNKLGEFRLRHIYIET